ncbi:MAG: tail fiber domain-containing protein, partial [Candidatus Moranbacteria bacterium]|nr:tail fiber domain-containing protein [Candidatus Moranbacteria bacterium]
GGTMTGGITNSTSLNPLTTLAESWIGPSSTAGIYFKGGNVGVGTTGPGYKLDVNGTLNASGATTLGSTLAVVGVTTTLGNQGSVKLILNGTAGAKNWQMDVGALTTGYLNFTPSTANGGATFTTPVMVIGDSGNIGIGTTAPGAKLDVANVSAGINEGIRLTHKNDYSAGSKITWNMGGAAESANITSSWFPASTAASYIAFSNTNTVGGLQEAMRITNGGAGTGYVGIGTTSPAFTLDLVTGNTNNAMRIIPNAAGSTTFRLDAFNDGATNRNFAFRNRYNALGRLELMKSSSATGDPTTVIQQWDDTLGTSFPSGNVGIGTANPLTALHILKSGGTTYGSSDQLRISSGVSGQRAELHLTDGITSDAFLSFLPSTTATSRYIELSANGANGGLTVLGNGNVGIGTTGPGAALHLYRADTSNSQLVIQNKVADYTTGTAGLRFDVVGDLQTGHIYSSFVAPGTWDKSFMRFQVPNSSGTLTDTMTLTNGNVGIGTTNPTALLSVGATSQFQVSSAGAITSVGVNSGSGLIQGTGGLTITGTVTLPSSSITNLNLANSTISGIALGSNLATLTIGTHLTGTSFNGSTGVTIATDATNANTISTIVARDASGNFSAGTITATLTGNASTVTGLAVTAGQTLTVTTGGTIASGSAAYTLASAYATSAQGTTADNALPKAGGTMTGGITNSTSVNPLTTLAESWIGPSSTAGIYFKGGNVGIGTTGPGAKLEIAGAANQLRLSDAGNPSANYYDIVRNGSTGYLDFQGSQATYNGFLFKNNSAATILYLDPTQKVGIGKTPSVALDVNGSASVSGNTILSGNITGGASGALYYDSANAQLRNGNSPTGLFFGGQGEFQARRESANATIRIVSVGATSQSYLAFDRARGTIASPTGVLSGDVIGSVVGVAYDGVSATMTHGPQITLSTTEDWDATHNGNRIDFYTIANGTTNQVNTLALNQGNVSMAGNLTVSGSGNTTINGNVGIGSTGPGARLQVVGADDLSTSFAAKLGGATTTGLVITNSGKVGIGTTDPGDKLEVRGPDTSSISISQGSPSTTKFHMGQFSNGFYMFNNYFYRGGQTTDDATTGSTGILLDANAIVFQHAPASVTPARVTDMYIRNDGNVGIGTTSPLYKLDVKSAGTDIARFQGSGSTGCTFSDGGVISCSSDENLKKNISGIEYGLATVMSLRPVEYNWKTENNSVTKSLGFIAQDVEQIIPKLVTTNSDGLKQLNTIGLVPVAIRAIQQQQTQITGLTDNQNKIVNQLTGQLADQNLTVDNKLQLIGQSLDNIQTQVVASLQAQLDKQTKDITDLQKQMADIHRKIGSRWRGGGSVQCESSGH